MSKDCTCGSGKPYAECCEPVISGKTVPTTAAQVMRARYSAYARGEIDYLKESMAPRLQKSFDADSSREWSRNAEWLGMEIVNTEGGQEGDENGTVEFIARYRQDGQDLEHHELAEFTREKGTWYFVDGKLISPAPIRRAEPKIGRNEPCPCGSGRKHKKCCGART